MRKRRSCSAIRVGQPETGSHSLTALYKSSTPFVTAESAGCKDVSRTEDQLFAASDTIQSNAPLFHIWGIPWGSSVRRPFGHARRIEGRSSFPGSRTLASSAGLRPRRPHEDRARYRAHPFRSAPRDDYWLTHRRSAG